MHDSFPDTPIRTSSFPTDVALPVGPYVTLVTTATLESAPLQNYVDFGKDWAKVSVGGPFSTSQPLQTALVDLNAVLSGPITPKQDYIEGAPTSLPFSYAIGSHHPMVASQPSVARTGDIPDCLRIAPASDPPDLSCCVTSPVVHSPFQVSPSTTDVPSESLPSSRSTSLDPSKDRPIRLLCLLLAQSTFGLPLLLAPAGVALGFLCERLA